MPTIKTKNNYYDGMTADQLRSSIDAMKLTRDRERNIFIRKSIQADIDRAQWIFDKRYGSSSNGDSKTQGSTGA